MNPSAGVEVQLCLLCQPVIDEGHAHASRAFFFPLSMPRTSNSSARAPAKEGEESEHVQPLIDEDISRARDI